MPGDADAKIQATYAVLERLMHQASDDQHALSKLHRKVGEASTTMVANSLRMERSAKALITAQVQCHLGAIEDDLEHRLKPVIDAAADARITFEKGATDATLQLKRVVTGISIVMSIIAMVAVGVTGTILSQWFAVPREMAEQSRALAGLSDQVQRVALYSQNADVRWCQYQAQRVLCVRVIPEAKLVSDNAGGSFAVLSQVDRSLAPSGVLRTEVNRGRDAKKSPAAQSPRAH